MGKLKAFFIFLEWEKDTLSSFTHYRAWNFSYSNKIIDEKQIDYPQEKKYQWPQIFQSLLNILS